LVNLDSWLVSWGAPFHILVTSGAQSGFLPKLRISLGHEMNPKRTPDFPTYLDMDLSSKCNLRCSFCHLSYFKVKDPTQVTYAQFKEWVAPFLGNLKSITLFSKYEPLICRDFIPIFNLIADQGIETYFSSNGILLNDAVIEAIVGRLTYLTVSVTGFTRESYRRCMGSDSLAVVDGNLSRLVAAKRARGTKYPLLRISTVGMLDIIGELPLAVDFARRHEAEEGIQLTSLIAYDKDMAERMPLRDPESFMTAARAAQGYAEQQGVRLILQSGDIGENQEATREIGHRPCYIPWQRLSIQPNGDVYPCPVAYKPIGNLHDGDLKEIWESEALGGFRNGVNDLGNMNEDCRNCTHCRHKSIVRKDGNDFTETENYIGGMTRKRTDGTPDPI
jgi:radical SAM protein with 4Fe4S-binding SPASM domain